MNKTTINKLENKELESVAGSSPAIGDIIGGLWCPTCGIINACGHLNNAICNSDSDANRKHEYEMAATQFASAAIGIGLEIALYEGVKHCFKKIRGNKK